MNVAEVTPLAPNTCDTELANLADVAFVPPLLGAFRDILTSPVANRVVQTQRNLVAKLISLLCREDRQQVNLADSGILDALATNLASVIVARGFAIPGAEQAALADGIQDLFPDPAILGTDVTAIFEALSAIIGDSRWRASTLIYSPAILTVFPNSGAPRQSKASKACATAFEVAGLSSILPKDIGLMDCFLAVVPEAQTKGASTVNPFPPLGSSPLREAPSMAWNTSPFNWDTAQTDLGTAPEGEVEDNESPLIPWLIQATRSSDGMERVTAASVVVSLFKAGLANKSREAYMGRLIVPILLQGLEDTSATLSNGEASFTDTETSINRSIIERSLTVVAKLVVDNDFLQKCAIECSAVKIISKCLKGAYEPVLSKATRPWSPTPQHEKTGREIGIPTSRLGPRGQAPLLAHHIRVREVALKAIATLAGKDDYGKAFVEQDLVPFVVESLSATPSKPTKDGPKSPKIRLGRDDSAGFDAAYGANPVSVTIAACHALRTLARSVSILRTTLQDCGVVSPAFRLLRHADLEVQIAASGLMCNLVTNVSPMRDVGPTFSTKPRTIQADHFLQQLDLVGVMRVLCGQTRSQNPVLRLNALWALKHWVDGANFSAKKDCLEELTPGWLIQLIHEDTEDDALYQRMARNEKQVANNMDEDVEMAQPGDESRTSISSLLQHAASTSSTSGPARTARLRQAEETVAELREAELNPARKVRDDDLAIQEQGLNFLRNLIGSVNSATDSARDHAEMIEHLFTVLDSSRFFEILHSKLRPKILHPFGRRHNPSRQDARVLYPQARIVSAVVYILVHVAASIPRHRQILTSQEKLLADLGKQFGSKDKDVRVALCHLITNLTWRDDPDDEISSRDRAIELKRLGLLGKLETLESTDPNLDVRERAKAAIWQINKPRGF